jgi:hypothetical protein
MCWEAGIHDGGVPQIGGRVGGGLFRVLQQGGGEGGGGRGADYIGGFTHSGRSGAAANVAEAATATVVGDVFVAVVVSVQFGGFVAFCRSLGTFCLIFSGPCRSVLILGHSSPFLLGAAAPVSFSTGGLAFTILLSGQQSE